MYSTTVTVTSSVPRANRCKESLINDITAILAVTLSQVVQTLIIPKNHLPLCRNLILFTDGVKDTQHVPRDDRSKWSIKVYNSNRSLDSRIIEKKRSPNPHCFCISAIKAI
ncbi:hypothetical protein CONCODRAFT_12579 [Conidiobolus coronatus NRRL 28638]|uniref:Uncharacterized protein n=1 Tax=Conidiobolus coronatus (strain ATCC 28846 / CBS 209.66 / NRRL 28638) TaxID=796925 RepID=A0A137NSL5_CONC2|nr:hypothetical protein CONCODRAFT_12579 [Conidiobolus coronatus NRRL 28638]|eukprot:KXN65759.1 hypothetical protein CONCODRAFT_12579 [Conidiobolus coronatus NRRL 28638]